MSSADVDSLGYCTYVELGTSSVGNFGGSFPFPFNTKIPMPCLMAVLAAPRYATLAN
jgi:hypothetical protein